MALIDRWRKDRPQEPKVIDPEELGDWYDDDEDPFTDEWDDPSFYPDEYYGTETDDDDD